MAVEWHHTLDEVLGDDSGVTGVRLRHVESGATEELPSSMGVFVASRPSSEYHRLFEGQLEMQGGYIQGPVRPGRQCHPDQHPRCLCLW